jgi:hypothetical protein
VELEPVEVDAAQHAGDLFALGVLEHADQLDAPRDTFGDRSRRLQVETARRARHEVQPEQIAPARSRSRRRPGG